MWPNDADGNAIRESLGPLLKKAGYTIVDPGAYSDGTNEYSSQIAKFKAEDCEIFNTFPIPPDFATFWPQAAQQGYKPKIAQIAKTGLFPSQVEALGSIGEGLASGVYWAPTWPYKSLADERRLKALGDGYESAAGKQWNQQLGASLALFDAAAAAFKASSDPKDKKGLADAIGNALGRHADRQAGLDEGAGVQRRRDTDHRRPVERRAGGQQVQARLRHLRELLRPERPDRRQAGACTRPEGVPLLVSLMTSTSPRSDSRTPVLQGESLVKRYGELVVLERRRLRRGARRGGRHRRAERGRQDDAAQCPGRIGHSRSGPGAPRRRGRHQAARAGALPARDRPRVPDTPPVRRDDGAGERPRRRVLRRRAAARRRLPRGPSTRSSCAAWSTLANRRAASLGLLHRKRLELARALATDPRVLLLDEIGGGLTDAESEQLVATIRELRHRDIVIVWIEHIVHVLLAGGGPARLHGRRP